jgi:fibronectin-binding autotransporter adhesin
MAATTTLLGLVTPTQGSLSGAWGDTVNYGISDYVDIAIAGTLSFAGDGAITLANTLGSSAGNGITSTTAQYMVIRITGTQTVTKVITGPSYSKLYMVDHAGATSAVTFKAAAQTGVSVAVGEKCFVYYNGTDYVKVASSVADGVTSVAGTGTVNGITLTGTVTSTGSLTLGGALTGVNLTSQVTGTLPVLNGGTGVTTPALVAGTNVTISGTWPNQTINSTNGGGTVTGVTASLPITSSGGAAPNLTFLAPGTVGNVLTSTGSAWASSAAATGIPSQAGNGGKYLTTDGTNASWTETGAAAGGSIYVNNTVISMNYTIASGQNGFSVGPITISSGYAVTVSSGQSWVIL